MTKIQPLNDKVILKIINENNVTKFGICLPEIVNKENIIGEVLAIGKGQIQKDIKEGDKVLFDKEQNVKIDGEYVIIDYYNILGVFH